ncbi:MAG: toxin-antitoxin system YwqK family antitoxin [Chitinophagaceae bacterium]|nr:toxin-antitoxin system YwqK family antitoxin [Chitinophagaceae bacterium]
MAQQFEKFSRFYDFNNKVTEEKLRAHYLYLYEYTDSICRRTDYYMKEESVKAIAFFTDTSCKTKVGQYISYYPNKKLESKGMYAKNKKEGLWLSYYENGNKKDSTVYKNNNATGTSFTWFEDGNINIKREMDTDGKGNGKETSYWQNGKLDFEGIWANGKKNGLWIYHHFNGNKSAEVVYEKNTIITSKCFDENGTEEKICDSAKVKKAPLMLKDGTPLTKYIQRALNENTDWKSRDLPLEGGIFFVWVSFTVDIDGTIKDIKLEHGVVQSLNKTSIKIFKDLKEMKPAFEFNRKYGNRYTQRMEFRVGKDRF